MLINNLYPKIRNQGFTLIEMLAIFALSSIILAISAPSILGILGRQSLNSAVGELYSAMSQAQTKAQAEQLIWQISFRQVNSQVQWAIHRQDDEYADAQWQSLPDNVLIDKGNTTFYRYPSTDVWRVQFKQNGATNGRLGRITLSSQYSSNDKKCIFVSTLLGTLRTDRNKDCD